MRAIIKNAAQNAKQPNNKEMVDTINVVAKVKGYDGKIELSSIVTARFYMSRSGDGASPVYCCMWAHGGGDKPSISGYGMAGGYGYHKRSAALAVAIRSAGIDLFGDQYGRDTSAKRNKEPARIDGVGDSAMDDALVAIAKACGAIGQCLVVRN